MSRLVGLVGALLWLWGVVLAKGFWMTVAALIIPFFGWFLVVQHLVS